MRVTSHCVNHPSREAGQRCRSCGAWLCDRCVRPMRGHVFCGLKCWVHDLVKRGTSRLTAILRSTVSPVWTAMVIILVTLAAGWWIVSLAVRLSGMSDEQRPFQGSTPYAVAEMVRDGDALTIEIQGSPGATVVIFANQVPIRVLTLDEEGRGSVDDVEITSRASLGSAVLAEPPEAITPPPTLTPTNTPTLTPTSTPTRTSTRTVTATASPSTTPSPSATSTATPTATSTATRSPSRTPKTPADRPATTPTRTDSTHRSDRAASTPKPPVLHLVTDAGNKIAVTFDGNASSNGTAELLDLLQELDLKITLFVTGGFVERYPKLVRQAVLAGHEVGNHTFSHPHLTTYADNRRHNLLPKVTKAWFYDQLKRTEAAFQKATGRPMAPLWRSPFGEENSTLRGWAMELGYLHVRWSSLKGASLDARDWVADEHSSLYQDSRKMMDRLLGFPHLEGGIVLMHLSTERSEPPWTELPRFVRELKRREVEPVRVSDLLEESKTWRKWLERARENHNKNFPE